MGLAAIPVSEILTYGRAFGFADLDELLGRVRAADAAFLEWHQGCDKKPAAPDLAAETARKLGIELPQGD